MKIVFLDAETLGSDLDLESFTTLGEVKIWPLSPPETLKDHLAGAQIVILNKVKITREILALAPDLRLIALTATGYNNVDLEACRDRGVAVANVRGYSTASVAQHTLALTLALAENLFFHHSQVAQGTWSRTGRFFHLEKTFHEIAGKRWGILGLGAIGTAVARIAETLGAQVTYYSVSGQDRPGPWPRLSWEDFLATSDILSIHAPLTPATHHLITLKDLSKMKKTALLINVARGALVRETDLAQALRDGLIAGAAVDVFETEPLPPDHPFLEFQDSGKLLLTPHIAWASVESRRRCLAEVWENIAAFQRGESRQRLV